MNKKLDIRDRVMLLLRKGYVTQVEAARLGKVSRQRVFQWVQQDGLRPSEAREKHLRQLMKETANGS